MAVARRGRIYAGVAFQFFEVLVSTHTRARAVYITAMSFEHPAYKTSAYPYGHSASAYTGSPYDYGHTNSPYEQAYTRSPYESAYRAYDRSPYTSSPYEHAYTRAPSSAYEPLADPRNVLTSARSSSRSGSTKSAYAKTRANAFGRTSCKTCAGCGCDMNEDHGFY